jgi:hypothetical protein
MWYREDKGTLTAQLNLWKIKPSVEFAMGYKNYNPSFDFWDAPFYEGGLGVAFEKPVSAQIYCFAGAAPAKPHTFHDPSNNYGGADADISLPFGSWVPGIKVWVKDLVYTTRDSLPEKHTDRKDFQGDANLYVKHKWGTLGVTAMTGFSWRNTTSPIAKVDTRKDFGALRGGIEFSWEFKKKF